jgi:hypothetical protein
MVTAFLVFALFYFFVFSPLPGWEQNSDFVVYLTGARLIAEGQGHRLYDLNTQLEAQNAILSPDFREEVSPFRYLPPVGLPFILLVFLPLKSGYQILNLINLVVLLWFIAKTYEAWPRLRRYVWWPVWVFLFLPVFYTMGQSQASLLILGGLFLTYLSLKRKKYFLAGIASGAFLIKIQLSILIPFFLILAKDKKAYLSSFLLVFALMAVLSILIIGPQAFLAYPAFLFQTETYQLGSEFGNMPTLRALINSLSLWPTITVLTLNGLVYLFCLLIFKIKAKKTFSDLDFIAAILLAIPLAVHLYGYDLVLLLVPLSLLFVHLPKRIGQNQMAPRLIFLVIWIMPWLGVIKLNLVAPLILGPIAFFLLNQG